MNSDQHSLLDFISGKRIFQLPVYQRNYDWKKQQVDRFLEDIDSLINGLNKHFLGVIVGIEEKNPSAILQRTIIDGQQRLATTMIFLKALYDVADMKEYYSKDNDDLAKEIYSQYLTYRLKGKDIVKLQLIDFDQKNFLQLLEDPNKCDLDSRIWQNYQICKDQILNWVRKDDRNLRDDILNAFAKIQIVYLKLVDGEDDPQLIFDSINSTGLGLLDADKIRNFLLMGITSREEQNRLFRDYWLKIADENLHRMNDVIDNFFMSYVTCKLGVNVKKDDVYDKFKELCKNVDREEMFIDLKKFSKYFEAFVFGIGNYSAAIHDCLKKLSKLKQTTCFPFLLQIFDDYANHVIDEKTLENVLKFVVEYHVQAVTCGVPSRSRDKFFATLYRRIFEVESNRDRYLEAIRKYVCMTQGDNQMPSNEEFYESLLTIKLFKSKPLCKFILEEIAGIGSEKLKPVMILPDDFDDSWNRSIPEDKKVFPEQHELYRYRLGNLTLATKDAPELAFSKKKSIFQEDAAIDLNIDVINQPYWAIDQIEERGLRLARIIAGRYEVERSFDPSIVFDSKLTVLPKLTLEDWQQLLDKKLLGFSFLGITREKTIWRNMFEDVIKMLFERNPKLMDSLASDEGFNYPQVTREKFVGALELRSNIFVRTSYDQKTLLLSLQNILNRYKIAFNKISFTVAEK